MFIPTTLKIGGPAALFCQPRGFRKILRCCEILQENGTSYRVLGGGSNLLVNDRGVKGAVIRSCWLPEEVAIEGTRVEVPAGMALSQLMRVVVEAGLAGLEFAAGIPGTVGGAVVMNAGWGGEEFGGLVRKIWVYRPSVGVVELNRSQCQFGYRSSRFQESGEVILRVGLRLEFGDLEEMRAKKRKVLRQRRATLPLEYPSAGSVFKNPPGDYAGCLIESVGLKGKRIGGAQISDKHANFIINRGRATYRDVRRLIDLVQNEVRKQAGIDLELEIKVWEL